jgi:hypothetical protein
LATSTSGSLASTRSASSTSSTSPSPSTTGTGGGDGGGGGGLSGGAIGGIVGGVVGGLALLGAVGFFLWRRKKKAHAADVYDTSTTPYTSNGYQPAATEPPAGAYVAEAPVTEKYAHRGQHAGGGYTDGPVAPVELSGNTPVEMPASAREY